MYFEGYEYCPSVYYSYKESLTEEQLVALKSRKLGQVKINIRGNPVNGVPSDFSSTFDVGSEIYAIKDTKVERAVIVKTEFGNAVLYRYRKAIQEYGNSPINLNLSDVFNMMTDKPQVKEVKLFSKENSSVIASSKDEQLINLINKELPSQKLINFPPQGKQIDFATGVQVNLVFSGDEELNITVYQGQGYATVFGGYFSLSPALSEAFKKLDALKPPSDKFTQHLPFKIGDVKYFTAQYILTGEKADFSSFEKANGMLSGLLNYSVQEVNLDKTNKLIMTCTFGPTQADSKIIQFYGKENNEITIGLDGYFYKFTELNMTEKNLHDWFSKLLIISSAK